MLTGIWRDGSRAPPQQKRGRASSTASGFDSILINLKQVRICTNVLKISPHSTRRPSPGGMQALDCDATHRDDISIVHGDIGPLNSVFLPADDFEARDAAGHGAVSSRVVMVLVGGKHFADRHALCARRF